MVPAAQNDGCDGIPVVMRNAYDGVISRAFHCGPLELTRHTQSQSLYDKIAETLVRNCAAPPLVNPTSGELTSTVSESERSANLSSYGAFSTNCSAR